MKPSTSLDDFSRGIPGAYAGIPYDAYRSAPGLSRSDVVELSRSIDHWRRWRYEGGGTTSAAAELGILAHVRVLEPERWAAEYAPAPPLPEGALDTVDELKEACRERGLKLSGRKSDLVERLEAHAIETGETIPLRATLEREALEALGGRSPVSPGTWTTLERMAAAVDHYVSALEELEEASHFAAALRQGEPELTILWTDEETGLALKARLDLASLRHGVVMDLKTTSDALPGAFARSCRSWAYHRQDAFYRDALASVGVPEPAFAFLALETSAPHGVRLYTLTSDDVRRGERENRLALRRYAAHIGFAEDWTGYPVRPLELRLFQGAA